MSEGFLFKELQVWQKSMELVDWVYAAMRVFPKEERFRLCDQLSRAVVSIPSNIAEGSGRNSDADFARFLAMARGSLFETVTQLEIAKQQGYIDDITQAEEYANSIRKMLNAFITKLTTP